MKKTSHTTYVFAATVVLSFFAGTVANAVTFTPSEQLFTEQGITTFTGLVQWLFPVTLSIVAVLAVFVIMRAGFTLVFSAENPSSRADARSRIKNAIIGLVIAFGSVLILRTINPDLVRLRFELGAPLALPDALYEGTIFGRRAPDSREPRGAACASSDQCQEGLVCVQIEGVGTCEPLSQHPEAAPGGGRAPRINMPLRRGERCPQEGRECTQGTTCDQRSNTCLLQQ